MNKTRDTFEIYFFQNNIQETFYNYLVELNNIVKFFFCGLYASHLGGQKGYICEVLLESRYFEFEYL